MGWLPVQYDELLAAAVLVTAGYYWDRVVTTEAVQSLPTSCQDIRQ